MKKEKIILSFIVLVLSLQVAYGAIYECTYKTKNGVKVTSSYNPILINKPNYKELQQAYRLGNCEELYVKKYFIDGVSCNIQFYKRNMKIGNLVCKDNNKEALKKLRDIAVSEYGYMGK